MEHKIPGGGSAAKPAGSNWLALQKASQTIAAPSTSKKSVKSKSRIPSASARPTVSPNPQAQTQTQTVSRLPTASVVDGFAVSKQIQMLQQLVLGNGKATEVSTDPGRYLALDCEMVGVGEGGEESSLARASMVDIEGRIVLDEFVIQRERVVDYRTKVSGVRAEDMVNAKSFKEVQKRIAELLEPEDRILVGHALRNDLKALMLKHPASRTRDTQVYAKKRPRPGMGGARVGLTLWEKYRSKRIGLKKLTRGELGVDIQGGEHSSITDARAAMAIYRLHKHAWDASIAAKMLKNVPVKVVKSAPAKEAVGAAGLVPSKRKHESSAESGKRGMSSMKRDKRSETHWWENLEKEMRVL